MRADGYYWVKYNGEWEVAHFDSSQWGIILHDVLVYDDFFDEIDERRIERAEKAFKCMVSDCKNPNNGKSALCEDHYKEAIDDMSPIERINSPNKEDYLLPGETTLPGYDWDENKKSWIPK